MSCEFGVRLTRFTGGLFKGMSKNNVNKYDMVANDGLSSDEIFLNIWVGIKIQVFLSSLS